VKRREFHTTIIGVAGEAISQKVAGVTFVSSTKVAPYQSHDYVTALADHVNQSRNEQGGSPAHSDGAQARGTHRYS
jgi:hypothetical protein